MQQVWSGNFVRDSQQEMPSARPFYERLSAQEPGCSSVRSEDLIEVDKYPSTQGAEQGLSELGESIIKIMNFR